MWKSGVLINLKIVVYCIACTVSFCLVPNHLPCAGNETWMWSKTYSTFIYSFHRLFSSRYFQFNTQHILFWSSCFHLSTSEQSASLHMSKMFSHISQLTRIACMKFSHVVRWFRDRLNWYTKWVWKSQFLCCLLPTHGSWQRGEKLKLTKKKKEAKDREVCFLMQERKMVRNESTADVSEWRRSWRWFDNWKPKTISQ